MKNRKVGIVIAITVLTAGVSYILWKVLLKKDRWFRMGRY